MISEIQILAPLLSVIIVVAVIAPRLKVPPSILLVLTGILLALIPGLPQVDLAPDFVLLLVLPPIIYSSAVAMSWREFRLNLRPISLLAIGCVVFTTIAIAMASHWILALPWSVGFVLGAIVSPPDAVAPLSIARRMQLPRRLLVILEGEGLANDATALVLYRFAVAAVSVGAFSFKLALGTFSAILVGELLWGIGVGWAMLRLRRWAHNERVEIALSVLTPFVAYWPPHQIGGSGVLATVAAGLYISWNGLRLISAATRLQGIFFWDFFIYLIEGMIFLITGLQARSLISGIGAYSTSQLTISALVVSAAVIGTRFVWLYPATYLPRWISPALRRRDPSPPWQWPFALAFTGIRGIVSLAAALAIPLSTGNGAPFPDRDLLIFLTFSVIVVTLVGQGLMLPSVIRALGLANAGRLEHDANRVEEFKARQKAIEAVIERLQLYQTERQVPDEIVEPFRVRHADRLKKAIQGGDEDGELLQSDEEIELLLIDTERETVNDLYSRAELKEEARRRIERELDLREAALSRSRSDD